MSTTIPQVSRALDFSGFSPEIPSITERDRRKAEDTGKQWVRETKDKLGAGLEVWTRLVDPGMEAAYAQESAELFGIATAALDEGKLRDCLLMHACEGTLENLGSEKSGNYIEETFLKLEQRAPDREDITVMCSLLKMCCAYASAEQGYPFALMAYLLWWTGKFRFAYDYVGRALERDSDNSLARLLSRVLEVRVVPPWLARECGSFHIVALE